MHIQTRKGECNIYYLIHIYLSFLSSTQHSIKYHLLQIHLSKQHADIHLVIFKYYIYIDVFSYPYNI